MNKFYLLPLLVAFFLTSLPTQAQMDLGKFHLSLENDHSWSFSILGVHEDRAEEHSTKELKGPSLGFGWVGAVAADHSYDMGVSKEIFFNFFTIRHSSARNRRHSFQWGLGMAWRNARLDYGQMFTFDGHHTAVQPVDEGNDVGKSRVKVCSVVLPLHYVYRPAKHWKIRAGVNVNFNYRASLLTKGRDEVGHTWHTYTSRARKTPVTPDIWLSAHYRQVGIYGKYSPVHVFRHNYGPDLSTMSVGMTFFY